MQDGCEPENPPPFLFNGENYLCKMFSDIDFVADGLGDRGTCMLNTNYVLTAQS